MLVRGINSCEVGRVGAVAGSGGERGRAALGKCYLAKSEVLVSPGMPREMFVSDALLGGWWA